MAPIQAGRGLARQSFEAANKIGDLTYASYYCNAAITNMLAAGDPLSEVQQEAEKGLSFVQRARFRLVEDIIGAQLEFVRALRGLKPAFGCFDDDLFNEARFERRLAGDPGLAAG